MRNPLARILCATPLRCQGKDFAKRFADGCCAGVAYEVSMPKKKMPAAALEFFRKAGSKGGKLGTKARMEKLTAEQRSEFAKAAAVARWKDKKPAPKGAIRD